MSYRAFNSRTSGKGVRGNYRAQLNRIRRTRATEVLEHLSTEEPSSGYIDIVKAFESTARRRAQPEVVGEAAEE